MHSTIPKTIHYCWFGNGEKPKLAKKCIESWKTYCPDYFFIEWNEKNFDISKYQYTRYCYKEKKWAFLSDFVRLIVVYENGGIYLDTDVEIIKSLDELLTNDAFYGFENDEYVATGLGFGAQPNNSTVKAMIEEYNKLKTDKKGNYELINCPRLNTKALMDFGLVCNGKKQSIRSAEIYPAEFFNPLNDATGELLITENTYTINHYGKSWLNKGLKLKSKISRPIHRLFGTGFFDLLKK